jgi:hypothetical protein
MPQNRRSETLLLLSENKVRQTGAAPKTTPQNQRSFATPPEAALPLAEFFMIPADGLRSLSLSRRH